MGRGRADTKKARERRAVRGVALKVAGVEVNVDPEDVVGLSGVCAPGEAQEGRSWHASANLRCMVKSLRRRLGAI